MCLPAEHRVTQKRRPGLLLAFARNPTPGMLLLTFNFAIGRGIGHGVAVGCEAVAVLGLDGKRARQGVCHEPVVQNHARCPVIVHAVVALQVHPVDVDFWRCQPKRFVHLEQDERKILR
jgi:hypothetical protein